VRTFERPLALGELLAETIRLYGERIWSALGIGGLMAGSLVAAVSLGGLGAIAIFTCALTACAAAAARVVAGDSFAEAWAQVASRGPVLLVLAVIVWLPVVLMVTGVFLIGLLPAALWLGFLGFAVPAAAVELPPGRVGPSGVAIALGRAAALARAAYLHAVGIAAALLLLNLLLDVVLGGALVSFADNSRLAADALAQVVLGPLVLLGLSVLFFEQRVRALSSPRQGQTPRGRRDADVPDAVHAERAGDADAPRQSRADS